MFIRNEFFLQFVIGRILRMIFFSKLWLLNKSLRWIQVQHPWWKPTSGLKNFPNNHNYDFKNSFTIVSLFLICLHGVKEFGSPKKEHVMWQ